MTLSIKKRYLIPYLFMLAVYLLFLVFALVLDTPGNIWEGLWRIAFSRSILISDYIEIGGIGATLVNAAIVGTFSVAMMLINGIRPNGAIIMALWLSTGFAFFGKNILNMFPITAGVWLVSKYQKEPFINYALNALLCATLSPVVSELSFMGALRFPLGIILGVLLGMFTGFIFPTIAASTVSAHSGYCLYNMGFAGGLIATFVISVMKSLGIEPQSASIWNREHTLELAVLMYLVSLALIVLGLFCTERETLIRTLRNMLKQPGRLVSDFFFQYKEAVYINMGVLGILSTTIILLFGGTINGPTIGGIFTIIGFGSFGKHPRNVLPLMAGAMLCTYFNRWDPTSPANTLAILFSTGLAPIAGQFGWVWGVVAGFLHVNMATHVVAINSGLNLYNNGFAGGLAAMLLVPLILAFRRDRDD